VAIREQTLGPEHFAVATLLNDLAVLYEVEGNYAKAEPLFQRTLAIQEKTIGPTHPSVAITLENYAKLLRNTDHSDQAVQLEARAKSIREKASRHSPDRPLNTP
jgi:hypothetical protein